MHARSTVRKPTGTNGVVACAVVLIVACLPWIAPAPAHASDPTVGVIGDSITWQATADLEAILPAGRVDGVIGRTFSQAEERLAVMLSGGVPEVLVVALGTNPTMTLAQVDSFMAAAAAVQRVVFVNIRIPRDWESATNALIDSLPSRYPNVTVVDWHGFSASRPWVFNDSGFHLSDAGKPVFASLVAAGAYRAAGLCHPQDPGHPGPCAWDGTFLDDDLSVFQADIEWLAGAGITKGCDPPDNTRFCPDAFVTRGQLAAMVVRALGFVDDGGGDWFVDDDGSVFERDIDRMATAGVTKGCDPPDNTRFCPDAFVTRGQLAAMVVRALGFVDDGGGDWFVDDDGSVFERDIDRMATAGVTKGCDPPDNTRFCPDAFVTRGQLAAILHRALG